MPLNITIGGSRSAHGSERSYSDGEDSSGTGVHLSSPSAVDSQDYPESFDDWVVPYPDEIHPSDSASRPRTSNQHRPILDGHARPSRRTSERHSRERSIHRSNPRSHRQAPPIPAESVDSADEWPGYARDQFPPRTRGHESWSYAMRGPSPNHPQSFASSGYAYSPYPGHGGGPPGNQLIPFNNQPGYSYQGQPYSGGGGPGQNYYPHGHASPDQMSNTGMSTRSVPPYGGPPDMPPYGERGNYFPSNHHAYAVAQGLVPPMYYPYPMVHSPPLAPTPPPQVDNTKTDEQFARLERLLLEEKAQRDAKEAAAQKAAEELEARAAADRKAAEDAAVVQKALEEAAAKAAAAAKEEAEKKAAEDAAAAKKAADEAAAAAVAAAKPPADEKLKPIKFKDAVGRKFSFPFHLCKTWQGIEGLIRQAFLHVDVIGQHVAEGHYDLIGPNNEIILPQVWETMVEPDWNVTMHMWPMPEPPPPPPPPPPAEPTPPPGPLPPPPGQELPPQIVLVEPPKKGKGGHPHGRKHHPPQNFGPPPPPPGFPPGMEMLPPPPPMGPLGSPGPSDPAGPEILIVDNPGDPGPAPMAPSKKPQKVSPLVMWAAGRQRPPKKVREKPEAQHAVLGHVV